jgi:hypothetical protein
VLVIRDAQMRALSEHALYSQVEAGLERALPSRTSLLGRQDLRTAVQGAVSRARNFGLGEEQMLAYAALELVFGEKFSDDPQYGWAKTILASRELGPADKMQKVKEISIFFLAARAEEEEWAEAQGRREAALEADEI